MHILLIGDICGRPGRQAATQYIERLKREYTIDLIIANGENAAAGSGITRKVLDELLGMQIDVITSGNHIWDKKEVINFIDQNIPLIRPANYPAGTPGKGYCILTYQSKKIAVMNLSGRSFMPPLDCPFQTVDTLLREIADEKCDIVLLDFHAETTSEKMAMGWYLDGKVTCVFGTHTHVQTADERILPQGTAYITDLGMVGPWNSILGVKKEAVLEKFRTCMPVRFEVAAAPNVFSAVLLTLDDVDCHVKQIDRILLHD